MVRRRFRVFATVDDFTRKSLVLRVGASLPSSCVTLALEQAPQAHGVPQVRFQQVTVGVLQPISPCSHICSEPRNRGSRAGMFPPPSRFGRS